MQWTELVERIETPVRGTETHAVYMRMGKAQQDELKDVGGFVGGKLLNGRRRVSDVESRDIISLDLDAIPAGQTQAVIDRVAALGIVAVMYSTRKHDADKPRLRVLILLAETIKPDLYEPVARKLADEIGIEMCDPTTFDVNRLMYWPSCSSDSDYVYRVFNGNVVSANDVLASYGENEAWRDASRWPQVPGYRDTSRQSGKRQVDPKTKKGYVGAWCRVYDCAGVMESVIPGVYEQTADPTRYTYLGGSTSGGAIMYEDGSFLYSHHATDPCGGQLVNAWDLARIHMFGELDDGYNDDKHPERAPSFKAMRDYAGGDIAVRKELRKAMTATVDEDFGEGEEGEDPDAWKDKYLTIGDSGNYSPTPENFVAIMRYDPNLQGIRYDRLSNRITLSDDAKLPWNRGNGRGWTDTDANGLRGYLIDAYHMYSNAKLDDALMIVANEHSYDPIIEYLDSLPDWDGHRRIDTLLIDYFNAEDTEYVRAVTRKTFVAAVARQYSPGCKFDTALVLCGPQGIGKSTFFAKLGGEWFADGLTLFDMRDKTGAEKLQGRWIVEMSELVGMKKTESEAIKSFISCRNDVYRAAYGKTTVEHPRRCIIVGTTNAEDGFLRDTTGNRRFWPVRIEGVGANKAFDMTRNDVEQIWAEAKVRYMLGEPLNLTDDSVLAQANLEQNAMIEQDERTGLIEEYLEKLLPPNWKNLSMYERRMWLTGDFGASQGTERRTTVSGIEIWVECLGNSASNYSRAEALWIQRIMSNMPGWTDKPVRTVRIGEYGPQKVYARLDNVAVLRVPNS